MPDSPASTATSATVSGTTNGSHPALVNGIEYQVQVRVGNDRGDGGWSPSAAERPSEPQKHTAPTLTAGKRKLTVG